MYANWGNVQYHLWPKALSSLDPSRLQVAFLHLLVHRKSFCFTNLQKTGAKISFFGNALSTNWCKERPSNFTVRQPTSQPNSSLHLLDLALHPPKPRNMTMEKQPWMKMYRPIKRWWFSIVLDFGGVLLFVVFFTYVSFSFFADFTYGPTLHGGFLRNCYARTRRGVIEFHSVTAIFGRVCCRFVLKPVPLFSLPSHGPVLSVLPAGWSSARNQNALRRG